MKKVKKHSMFIGLALLSILLIFQNCGSSNPTSSSLYGGDSNYTSDDTLSAPKVNIVTRPSAFAKETSALFQLGVTSSAAGVDYQEYNLDNRGWLRIGTILNLENLSAGPHRVLFRAVDRKGKMSNEVLHSWVVDPALPQINFGSSNGIFVYGSNGLAAVNIPVTLADAHSLPTLEDCRVVGISNTAFSPVSCASSGVFNANLPAGTYRLSAQATDQAGNVAQRNFVFTVAANTSALPAPFLSIKPALSVNARDITFQVDAALITGTQLSCRLRNLDGTFTPIPCESGEVLQLNDLPVSTFDGTAGRFLNYTFQARLSRPSNNTHSEWVSHDWTIDTRAPVVTFSSPVNGANLAVNSVTVQFTATDNSRGALEVSCFLNGVERSCGTNFTQLLDLLPGGTHQFMVVAIDPAGNRVSNSVSWTNQSCNPAELSMQWPLSGAEGADWALLSYNDLNGTAGNIRDWNGATNSLAKAFDNSAGIQMTTGNYSTIRPENNFSRVFAAEGGVVTEVVNDKVDRIHTGAALTNCRSDATLNDFNYIKIRHSNGMFTRYDFLQAGTIPFTVGSIVAKGSYLGRLGASGCHEYPRLRFLTLNCDNSTPIDPLFTRVVSKPYSIPIRLVNTTFYRHSSDNFASTWANMIKNPPDQGSSLNITTTSGISIVTFITGAISTDRILYELVPLFTCRQNTLVDDDGNFVNQPISQLTLQNAVRGNSVGGIVVLGRANFPPTCRGNWKFRAIHVKNSNSAVLYDPNVNPVIEEKVFTVN